MRAFLADTPSPAAVRGLAVFIVASRRPLKKKNLDVVGNIDSHIPRDTDADERVQRKSINKCISSVPDLRSYVLIEGPAIYS